MADLPEPIDVAPLRVRLRRVEVQPLHRSHQVPAQALPQKVADLVQQPDGDERRQQRRPPAAPAPPAAPPPRPAPPPGVPIPAPPPAVPIPAPGAPDGASPDGASPDGAVDGCVVLVASLSRVVGCVVGCAKSYATACASR